METIVKAMLDRAKEILDMNMDVYIDQDGELQKEQLLVDTFEDMKDEIFELIAEEITEKELDEMEEEAQDYIKEAQFMRRNPLAYHGLSQKDFL